MAPRGDRNGMRTKPESIRRGAQLPQYVGASGGYSTAHRRAAARLGPPPEVCHCGAPASVSSIGRRLMELSYVGTDRRAIDRRGPFDPTGEKYIWECRACNQARRLDRGRNWRT